MLHFKKKLINSVKLSKKNSTEKNQFVTGQKCHTVKQQVSTTKSEPHTLLNIPYPNLPSTTKVLATLPVNLATRSLVVIPLTSYLTCHSPR